MTRDDIMALVNQTAGQHWMDEAHIQRFYHLARAAGEQAERDRTARLVADMQAELYQLRTAGRDT